MGDANSGFFREIGQNLFVGSVAFTRIVRPLWIEERQRYRFFGSLVTTGEKGGEAREQNDAAGARVDESSHSRKDTSAILKIRQWDTHDVEFVRN
jgi:hypothetical protein